MKKLLLSVVMVLAITASYAQKNVRQTASNYLKNGKLDKALENINICVQDPSTAQDAKSWFLRGSIYQEIANSKDENYRNLDPDPIGKAIESYKKAYEFDPKKEFYEDIFAKLNWQRNSYFNKAVDAYNNKNYLDAMNYFEAGANSLAAIDLPDTVSIFYAAACAGLANETAKAKQYYIQLIKDGSRNPAVYMSLSDLYRLEMDSVNALKVVREGRKMFPDDLKMFLAETNIYLTFGNTDKALSNLKYAIDKDPSNATVFFALGTIYDKLSNDTTRDESYRKLAFDDAIGAYQSAIKLDPDYFDANYNLGALFVNKAAEINNKANKLPLDAEAEFNSLKADADALLEKALPFLERASDLQPNDLNTLYSLKQIYARTSKIEKLKEVNLKIDSIQQK